MLFLDLGYDGYSQHLFTKQCFFVRVWHIVVVARFLRLFLSKYWICLNAYIFTGFLDVNHDEASSDRYSSQKRN